MEGRKPRQCYVERDGRKVSERARQDREGDRDRTAEQATREKESMRIGARLNAHDRESQKENREQREGSV